MKVVVNALSARRGGGQTYLLNLLRHLPPDAPLEVLLMAPPSLAVGPHPRIRRLPFPPAAGRNPYLRAAWERAALPHLLRREGARVLFCPGGVVATRAPRGCRTVTMFRNMIPFDPAVRARYRGKERVRNWLLERAQLASFRRADLVIFVSDFARGVIERRLGKGLRRAVTIPHGVGDEFRVDAGAPPPRPAWLPDGEYLLYVSIFDVYKAQKEVVRAFARLREIRKTPETLVLAGLADTPYGREVRALVSALGLGGAVVMPGAVPYAGLPAVYAHAKLNLFASECENCPNILLEALGSGRPLLASSRPPMPEFGGSAAVYFDPADPGELAARAAEVLDDPARLAAMGEAARRQAAGFDWARTAARTWSEIAALGADAA